MSRRCGWTGAGIEHRVGRTRANVPGTVLARGPSHGRTVERPHVAHG
eukprot:CAMPEP_0119412314 /NCGR_PEP_ID=MMETSP1335-20130426/4797_1 /TAXON_ID=259385 /ORGANISM="Chrysoculter rhomboideus, Strain RCC1486" /LENGTH=46 /DNA_ID= /DNA_START= /DNA_END= /DNA_ORIENTATION=